MRYVRAYGAEILRFGRTAFVFVCCLFALATQGLAQDVIRIAAIVNDEIISVFDLENRVRLVAATTNLPPQPDVFRRIRPQVLRAMINERLQMQEAARLSIRVRQREINGTISNFARQNRMSSDQLWSYLASRQVDRSALEAQIKARLLWFKVINRRLARQVSVGQDEVNDELDRLRAQRGKPRLKISEIFLSVDSSDADARVRETAERIIDQVVNGARFDALAREFSQSTTAGKGGYLGWLTDSELDEELAAAISVMQPGQISQPVRTLTGYHILLLSDRREPDASGAQRAKIEYRQMNFIIPANALPNEIENQTQLASQVSNGVRSCDAFVSEGQRIRASGMEKIRTVVTGQDRGPLVELLAKQQIGVPTFPQRVSGALILYTVCSRVAVEAGLPDPEALEERLRQQKIDLLAQRYMRDLRRSAFVDMRQ